MPKSASSLHPGQPVCVLGGGSFGTVLAMLLAENRCKVRWWMRDASLAESIAASGCNQHYLPDYTLPDGIATGTDLAWALEHPGLVVLALPSQAIPCVLQAIKPHLTSGHWLLSTAKGIPGPGFQLLHEWIERSLLELGRSPHAYALLSGPNIASEIAAKKIAATVIATRNRKLFDLCQQLLQRPYFRIFHNPDVFGVELGGALKNMYAIMAGMADAHHMGYNTKSALIVRATAEINSFAVQLGANPLTFLGMAGVGDLMATCASPQSRNYQAGYKLGQGVAPGELQQGIVGVIEGLRTLELVHVKARELGVRMPIVNGLHAIIYGRQNYLRIIRQLMESMQGADIGFFTT